MFARKTLMWVAAAAILAAPAGKALAEGTISGKITFKGGREAVKDEHKRTVVNMSADAQCQAIHGGKKVGTEDVIVEKAEDGAGLMNVLVSIKEGLSGDFKPPGDKVVLDQKGCMYEPHVFGIMAGQKLVIRNSDATLHNIHGLPQKNQEFNFGQPQAGMEKEMDLPFAETFRVKCDVHPWMGAYIGVYDHPFFSVSAKDGTFTLSNVPPGDYVVEAWHEVFGPMTQKVSVATGETKEANFEFTGE